MGEVRYLVMVSADSNNNKFYRMLPNGDGTWTAEYGRVGNSPAIQKYPMSKFETKYREKIRKGYIDQTKLVQDIIVAKTPKNEEEYKKIENEAIAEIVKKLIHMANIAISNNYTISSDKVTVAMVDEAQQIIDDLSSINGVYLFNNYLEKLFVTIPRKMGSVSDYLANSKDDFAKIIKREQDLLDVMRGNVVSSCNSDDDDDRATGNETILEKYGLVFEDCDDKDVEIIKKALKESSYKFSRAWKVTNLATQKKYDEFIKKNKIRKKKLLFHGSRNENWWSIIKTGLKLRPANAVITGKMFGIGMYFATKAKKSIGYTSLKGSYWANGRADVGYVALMEVAYGTPFDVYDFNSKYYSLNYEQLQKYKHGANCLHAHAGANLGYTSLKNDEIVIYKEEQCTIKYLVELKN